MKKLALLWRVALGSTCLPNAIPEDQRQNISINGISMPIGLSVGNWASAEVISEMYTILSSEILGYNTVQYFSLGTWASLHYLSGCVDGVMPAVNCTGPPQRHVALELWESGWQDPDWLAKADFLGSERAVQTSGSMGFSGVEGMFVMGRTRQNALERSGLHLSYYGFFNVSWFNPADYAPHVSEVNMSKLLTCAEANPPGAQNYIEATGDADGVETRNGAIVYKCWQEKWWVAPACRNNPSSCIAVITLRGWGNREISQQAFFHHMPLAIASALEFPEYVELNVQHQSFLFWWTPDSTFVEYDAVLVEMPPWNPSEQKQGILRSSMKQSMLTTGTSPILETAADRAWGLARALRLSDSNVNDLLVLSVENDYDYYAAACTWLKANQHVWEEWVPDKTKCSIGRGMVNSQGEFVTSHADAVDCAICPAGRASTKSSDSRLCTKCTPGSYQGTFGMSECKLCELGTMAVGEGAIQCDQCRLGEFANRTGMSFCYRCGAGSGQENLWTTSQEVDIEGKSVSIKLQGAISESYCHCDSGSFLWEDRCEVCMEGASCLGTDRLELLPGYFSKEELPGDVYKCSDERICPGGPPGSCAAGRDASSVACADCKEGFREGNDMVCEVCGDGDHVFFSMVVVVIVGAVAALYLVMLNETKWKQSTSSLVVAAGCQQLISIVQMLTVVKRFGIGWREPFESVLVSVQVLSFDVAMFSVSCVTQPGPVGLFTLRALMIPMLAFVALVVHICYLLFTRSKTFQMSNLLRTIGSIVLVIFIILFSMLLAPYQCNEHPNGKMTLKRYKTVFCNGADDHLAMILIGGFACLMPIIFLVVVTWTVMLELPRRIARSDTQFLAACGFLIKRFRPGMEMASVFFLIRNACVALCPLVSDTPGQLLMMSIILYVNSMMVAFFQPWRFLICNLLDNVLLGGMMVILNLGSVAVQESVPEETSTVAVLFLVLMGFCILGTICHGAYKHLQQKYRKQFRYFLCHQKNAAGSMARLLKMEIEKRLPGTKTFIDSDDLTDLTRLFSYVGQDTQNFLVLRSPDILTRQWCVGEMVTARANGVNTMLLTWPRFLLPDESFIAKYPMMVPDITELTKYGIGLGDVQDSFRWLATVPQQSLPEQISPTSTHFMVSSLVSFGQSRHSKNQSRGTYQSEFDTNFPVLVDPGNSEAVAAAMVLASLLKPALLGTNLPLPFIQLGGVKVPQEATRSLLICSSVCFKSEQLQTWLLQASRLPKCCMIPVITQDAFEMPSGAFFMELQTTSKLTDGELQLFAIVIKALFQEIAVVFTPESYASTHQDLQLRAKQAASRLIANLQPLEEKVSKLQTKFGRQTSMEEILRAKNVTKGGEESVDCNKALPLSEPFEKNQLPSDYVSQAF